MRLHILKTDHEYWDAIKAGDKTFELRKNDRDFKVGDFLALERTGTGRHLIVQVSHLTTFPAALRDGYVAMGFWLIVRCYDAEVGDHTDLQEWAIVEGVPQCQKCGAEFPYGAPSVVDGEMVF